MKAIIIGAGEVGFHTAAKLLTAEKNNDVVLIDESKEACQRVQEQLDLLTLQGPGASPPLLKEAGIEDAELLIAVTNCDEINILACLIASRYGVATKVARVSAPDYCSEEGGMSPADFGIDLLINPEQLCAQEFFQLLNIPEAREIVEFEGGKVQLVSFQVKATNPLQGKPMIRLGEEKFISDLRFTAIKRKNGTTIVPKGPDYILAGDQVFAIGSREAITHLLELSGVSLDRKLNRVIIAGAGRIGIYLAQALEEHDTQVKIIESNREQAEAASTVLKRTTVLHGDYLQPGFLEDAGIEGIDGFVSVTGDDENDIMACVTAKQRGAVRVLALVQNPRYLPILATIPALDAAVSRHLIAVGSILRLVRRGQIVSVAPLREVDAEVIELVAGVRSKIAHKTITSLRGKFPDDALIGAIVRRDRVIVPTGDCVIQPGDRVIVFSMPEAIPSVEKFFVE